MTASRPVVATATTVAVAAASASVMAAAWDVSSGQWWSDVALRAWGLLMLGAGYVLWLGWTRSSIGPLLVLVAGLYSIHFLRVSTHEVVFAVAFCSAYLWTAAIGHLVLTWPTGRVTSRLQGGLVVLGYLAAFGSQVARYVAEDPQPPLMFGIEDGNPPASRVASLLIAALALVVFGYRLWAWARTSEPRRRSHAPMLVVVGATAAGMIGASLSSALSMRSLELTMVTATLLVGAVAAPILYLARRQRNRQTTMRLARIALDVEHTLERDQAPGALERALADAVGDPTLRLVFPTGDARFVDVAGRPADDPATAGEGRAVTPIVRRGRTYACIDHDAALADEESVTAAAGAAAALALENAHLYATSHAQIAELAESRLGIATSAADERRRIQRDLHDGAQQDLFASLAFLDTAQHQLGPGPHAAAASVGRAQHALTDALARLRDIVDGLHPSSLLTDGVAGVVDELAQLSPIPVALDVDASRHRAEVETAAYFVVAEGLANVYRHSGAAAVAVTARQRDGGLVVEVTDRGRGGAEAGGAGLRSLASRVESAGGRLTVSTPDGGGTTLRAVFPASAPAAATTADQPGTDAGTQEPTCASSS